MDLEFAEAEPRIKCPRKGCDGILVKNKSKYAKEGTYTCNGMDGHFVTIPPEVLRKALEKREQMKKVDVMLDVIPKKKEKTIHVVKKEGQCVFG